MLGSKYGKQDRKSVVLYEYETFKATEGELLFDTYIRYLQVINDLKKCGYSKDNCELNFKFLNNLQPEWKQYATMMRQNKNLMDINIDALYNILKHNQGDVNDAMGSKKKTVVGFAAVLAVFKPERLKADIARINVLENVVEHFESCYKFDSWKNLTSHLPRVCLMLALAGFPSSLVSINSLGAKREYLEDPNSPLFGLSEPVQSFVSTGSIKRLEVGEQKLTSTFTYNVASLVHTNTTYQQKELQKQDNIVFLIELHGAVREVRWENFLAYFEQGGLGVGSLKAFNLVLLQKWRWIFTTNPDLLWFKLIKAIHGSEARFDGKGCATSGIWSSIETGLGNGEDVLTVDALIP
nr:RNA-directed DNA polymerase, eukaryota, reverse transcriptase zinc-binding domain protein [Tanacetum cinerariifolium]